ncbi:MAG: DUF1638 domain-containing protein [Armatimonadota bacterium]|nr:DUF1638 domain-containing protein [Armatimonadota bacterium]
MRIKLVACEVFFREVCHFAASSKNIFDITFVPFGLHCSPEQLRARLQQEIDSVEPGGCDVVALAYGLCSGGASGLTAGQVPLVLPRAHDCITLFLGSRERYDQEFSGNPGTYYYTSGWIERADGEVQQGNIVELKERDRDRRFEDYKEKYGEDNALFLIEQESRWLSNYNRAAFINTGLGDVEGYRRFTARVAATHGWANEEIEADARLIRRLIDGDWNEQGFLVVPPGRSIAQSFDGFVVKTV